MSEKLLSIIIPTLNEEENLRELLPYLRTYSSKNTEIIVADASESCDQSADVCRKYDIKRIVSNQCSRAEQMNFGAKNAIGDLLYFLHADTRPPISFEADIRNTLKASYHFGIFSYKFDSKNLLLRINSKFTRKKGIFAGGGDQSIFMDQTTFEKIGKFNTDYCIMEDFKFFHTAKKMGLKYKIVSNDIIVSARKYEKNSYLRVNVTNLIAFSMYHLGMKPEKIKKAYSYLLK